MIKSEKDSRAKTAAGKKTKTFLEGEEVDEPRENLGRTREKNKQW